MTALSTRERIEAKRKGIAANRSKGLRAYKFKTGTTSFRILPARDTAGTPNISGEFDRRFGKHYLKSFDGQNFFGIGDRDITYGESDVIRELIFDAVRQAPDEETKKHYLKMLASPRHVFCALILDDKDQPATEPVIIEVSEGAFDSILAQFEAWTDEDPDYDIASLENGHVFKCEKTGQGIDTKYTFTVTPKKAKLNAAILDKAPDLDAWIASQFENLEAKAIEFLGRLNGAAGITMSAAIIANANTPKLANATTASTTASSATAAATSASTGAHVAGPVTHVLEDEPEVVEEAVFVEADPVEEVVATPTPAPTPTPAASPAAAESDEIDDILAALQ